MSENYRCLSMAEGAWISLQLVMGGSFRAIARQQGSSPSTNSREFARMAVQCGTWPLRRRKWLISVVSVTQRSWRPIPVSGNIFSRLQWLWRYNNERPHTQLGGFTSAQKLVQAT